MRDDLYSYLSPLSADPHFQIREVGLVGVRWKKFRIVLAGL